MADAGARLVLLARTTEALRDTATAIRTRTGQEVDLVACNLADRESCTAAGQFLVKNHADLDGLIHNGAMWLTGSISDVSDIDIQNCIASAAIGSLILTRHLLPNLMAKFDADIHTVVSTSGLHNHPLDGASVVFHAAKHAQSGFVQGLSDELAATNIRVTAIFPGDFIDLSPTDSVWNDPGQSIDTLSTQDVVQAILFILNQRSKIAIRSLVIE